MQEDKVDVSDQQTMRFIDAARRSVPVNRQTTGLIIVDMQRASGDPDVGLGAYLKRMGWEGEGEYRYQRMREVVIPNVQKLLACWRKVAPEKIIYLRNGAQHSDYHDAPEHMRTFFEICENYRGSPANQILPEVAPLQGEEILDKVTMGAFASTDIKTRAALKGIKEMVVCGLSTNNCVDMTAREASERGFGVVLISDATATGSQAMQAETLRGFQRLWGRVAGTREVIEEMTGSC